MNIYPKELTGDPEIRRLERWVGGHPDRGFRVEGRPTNLGRFVRVELEFMGSVRTVLWQTYPTLKEAVDHVLALYTRWVKERRR